MKTWQKILFWLLTVDIVIGGFYWQWYYKLKINPDYRSPFGILDSWSGDLIMIGVWLYLFWIYAGQSSINKKRIESKEAHLNQILSYFTADAQITNDQVEKMLGVSDATAERYLNELEHQGKLEQIGKAGRWVTYRKV